MYSCIKVEEAELGIGVITLNRPNKRNAISIQMRREISDCLGKWKELDNIKVGIVTGEGSVFSAGFDLTEFMEVEHFQELYDSSARYHRDLWNFSKPLIAAVNGPALGGGLDLAALCDIRVCDGTASFGHPEIRFGAPPFITPLRSIVGEGIAREICLTGRIIDSQEAYRIGLVSDISAVNVRKRAIEIAGSILSAPLDTLIFTKNYLISNYGKSFEEAIANEHDKAFQEVILKKALSGQLIPKKS